MPVEQAERDRWATWTHVRAEAAAEAVAESAPRVPQPPRVLLPPPPPGFPPLFLPPPPAGWLLEDAPPGTPARVHNAGHPALQAPRQQQEMPPLASDSDDESYSSEGHRYWEEEGTGRNHPRWQRYWDEDGEWDALSANGGDWADREVNENF
jgi:hypothetical protein